ncbi:MAG: glycosyltransferase [bacterium]
MFELSLIINTMNRSDMIGEVFENIKVQSLERSRYEVLITDQSEDNKTEQIVINYPDYNYYKLYLKGLSVARNEAYTRARGKILVFVDDDVILPEQYLENILNFFDNSPLNPDMVGGKTHVKFLAEKPDWIEGSLLGILAYSDYGDEPIIYDNHPKHVPYGCNMAIKKSCLDTVGGFSNIIKSIDSKLTENEDVLLANKLRNKGYTLAYCPNMFLYHKMPASRLNFDYYKKRYLSQGQSDAYIYYLLGFYSLKDIPSKIILHFNRLIESIFQRFFSKNSTEKHYQKIRLYYNYGYIKALIHVLCKRGKFDENSRVSGKTII